MLQFEETEQKKIMAYVWDVSVKHKKYSTCTHQLKDYYSSHQTTLWSFMNETGTDGNILLKWILKK
jgi:hypothetical protein